MTFFWVLFGVASLCFFLSGIIAGYAFLSQRFNELVERYAEVRAKNDSLNKALEKKCSENDVLTKNNTALVETYSTLRKLQIYQQRKIYELQEQTIKDKEMVVQAAAFESTKAEFDEQIKKLNEENQMLSAQVNIQQRKIVEAERYREYVIKYNESLEMEKELRKQNNHLREEVKKLYSAGISLGNFGSKPLVYESKIDGSGVTTVFNRILINNVTKPGHRGAVISDEMGFVIASSSQYSEELAAISALFHYCRKIICDNIPFDTLSKITFVNNNNLLLTIAPMVINGQKVFYSGLTQGKKVIPLPVSKVTNAIIYS
ncbi:MAG: hypothetical protein JW915_12050 [Chitinispirillaceae bacterium]|nr:hypothetical protein [Chitinispirillaceae bacterium]